MAARELPARPNLQQYRKRAKATSCHPRDAGLQQPLIDVLLAHGARLDAVGAGNAHALVNGCLAIGRPEAAEYLASRGAPLDLEGAAGVGRLDLVKSFFNPDGSLRAPATVAQLKDGFTWACEYGRTDRTRRRPLTPAFDAIGADVVQQRRVMRACRAHTNQFRIGAQCALQRCRIADATADMYGGGCTTLGLVASTCSTAWCRRE